jgi:hypothetical protein
MVISFCHNRSMPRPLASNSSAFTFSLGLFPPPTRAHSDDVDYFTLLESLISQRYIEYDLEAQNRRCTEIGGTTCYHTRKKLFTQDEFDGPSQMLPVPMPPQGQARSQVLPTLPVHLRLEEQD